LTVFAVASFVLVGDDGEDGEEGEDGVLLLALGVFAGVVPEAGEVPSFPS